MVMESVSRSYVIFIVVFPGAYNSKGRVSAAFKIAGEGFEPPTFGL